MYNLLMSLNNNYLGEFKVYLSEYSQGTVIHSSRLPKVVLASLHMHSSSIKSYITLPQGERESDIGFYGQCEHYKDKFSIFLWVWRVCILYSRFFCIREWKYQKIDWLFVWVSSWDEINLSKCRDIRQVLILGSKTLVRRERIH